MSKLPQQLPLDQLSTKWASILNPIIAQPQATGLLLKNISMTTGDNTINHKLGKPLQGWIVVRNNAASTIYDKQDTNQMQDRTLVLNSSANCIVTLWVF